MHELKGTGCIRIRPQQYRRMRMCIQGTPCTQSVCTLGFAVRPIRPYPRIQGKEMNIHIDEGGSNQNEP